MLILAIDTALDACAAGVLDTDAGQLIAQESLPMKRGHAEALMPLIARVIKASGIAFAAPRPHRGDHRPRQLYRTAGRTFRRARHRAGRQQAGGRADHADGLCRAGRQPERRTSGHLRHRCAARPGVFSGRQRQWQFADPAARRADRGGARRSAVRRAASGRQRRRNSRRPLAGAMRRRRSRSMRNRRPISPGWPGSAPRSVPNTAPARPYYLRAPDAKPQKDMLQKAAQPPAS